MLDHLGLQVSDVEASLAFYVRTFAPIGLHEVMRFPAGDTFFVGLGDAGGIPDFWLGPADGAETRELHVGFVLPTARPWTRSTRPHVAAGTEVLHAPREWPEYHPGYYAVFLRDPDGHNVEAVFHGG